MKVLILHNAYRQKGGEDAVVEAESEMLRGHGVRVALHRVANDSIGTLGDKVRTFARARRNPESGRDVLATISRELPDVVHIHNFFPLLTPGIHRLLAERGLPVVQTLHNYRLLCANGMFLRDGAICELCQQGSRGHALIHRCYRHSLPATLAVLRMQDASVHSPAWLQSVSRFIALTEFARAKFIEGGLPASRIAVKPNSVPDPGQGREAAERTGALFVGRIAPEKGVAALVEASHAFPRLPLTVVGDGPELEALRHAAPPHVEFTGALPSAAVMDRMKSAAWLIMPSTWYEGFPMTLVEAFACGLPVIAPRLGGLAELVDHGNNGLLYDPSDPAGLERAIATAFAGHADRRHLSDGARETYLQRFSTKKNVAQLIDIYWTVLGR
ncbi:MAG: glycosyltransferase [Novosphingobium sp.]